MNIRKKNTKSKSVIHYADVLFFPLSCLAQRPDMFVTSPPLRQKLMCTQDICEGIHTVPEINATNSE